MADRYWVPGGTGVWTSSTNWSDTSGGASGASAPTSTDNAFIDSNSGVAAFSITGAITCSDFTIDYGFDISFSGGSSFNLYGSFNQPGVGKLTWGTNASSVSILGTGSHNINFRGENLFNPSFSGGGNYTLTGNLSAAGTSSRVKIQINNGSTINFGSNTVTTGYMSFVGNGVLNLDSCTLDLNPSIPLLSTIPGWFEGSSDPLTRVINAGTSLVKVRQYSNLHSLLTDVGGYTFNQLEFLTADTSEAYATRGLRLPDNTTIQNLLYSSLSGGQNVYLNLKLEGDVTINNFTAGTTNAQNRLIISSVTTRRTITVNSAPTGLTDVTFYDVTVTGTAAPITGTRVVSLAKTTGVTPSTPKTVYWNKAAGGDWINTDAWSDTPGGAVSVNNYPLPQDTAVVQNTGLNTSAAIRFPNLYATGDPLGLAKRTVSGFDASSRTDAMQLNLQNINVVWFFNGSYRASSSISYNTWGSQAINLVGEGIITCSGATLARPVLINVLNVVDGTYTIQDAFSVGANNLTLNNGTLDTNGFNVTAAAISTSNSNVRTLTLGSSLVTLSATDPFIATIATNLTVNVGTSILNCTNASISFANLNFATFPSFNVRVGSTQNCSLTNSNLQTFNNFSVLPTLTAYTARVVSLAGPVTVNGEFSCSTAAISQRIAIFSNASPTQRTITAASVSLANVTFQGINAEGAAIPFTGTSIGDLGFNNNITFTAPKTVYWVTAAGGNFTANNWALTSGGSAAEDNLPLPQDTAIIENTGLNASTTITLNNVGGFNYIPSLDMSTRTNVVTIALSTAYSVRGNWTNGSGVAFSGTQVLTFVGEGASNITSAGKTFSAGISVLKGTGSFTTLDALNIGANTLAILSGTFNTGDFNVTAGVFNSSSASPRTLNLGASIFTLSNNDPINTTTATNLTINNGTSWLSCTGNGITFASLNQTGSPFNVRVGATQNTSLSNARTHNKLQLVGPAAAGYRTITLAAGCQTTLLTGLETTSTAIQNRVLLTSATNGLRNTLVVNGSSSSLSDIDFRDVSVRGTSAPITGTRIGDLAGNIGITFPTKTVYWNLAGTQNFNAVAWAGSSGGTPDANNFPMPQDTAVFDESSAVGTVTLNNSGFNWIPNIDMSARTSAMTIALSTTYTVFGNWTNGSGTAFSGSTAQTFGGKKTQIITSAGKTFPCNITVDSFSGLVELGDALVTTGTLTLTNGTFDTKDFSVTAAILSSSNSNIRFLKLGSSTVTLTSTATALDFGTIVNFNFTPGTSQINLSSATTSTLSGGGATFNNVAFTTASTSLKTINGNNTFNNLSLTTTTAGLNPLAFGGNQTITGTLNVAGGSPTQRNVIKSSVFTAPRILTVATLSADHCDFEDITIAGTAAGSTVALTGDLGGNSGVTFVPKNVYWNLSGTQNWTDNGWASTSGGSPNVNNFPLAQDTAIFDEAGSVGTVNLGTVPYNFPSINASARTSAMTLGHNGTQTTFGNYTLGTGVTTSGTSAFTFGGRAAQAIDTAGVTLSFPLVVGVAGNLLTSVSLSADLVSSSSVTLTSGLFNANNHNLTIASFSSSNSNVRTLTMGSGLWTLSGTGTVWDTGTTTSLLLNKDTANITLSDTSTTARTFSGGGLPFNTLTIGGATGTSTLTINGNNQFSELASTKTVAHTILFANSSTTTIGKWSVTGTSGNVVTLNRVSSGVWNIVLAGDVPTGINFLAVNNCTVADTSPAEFYVGANSTLATTTRVVNTAPPASRTLYWVGGTGNWSDTARWSLSSGGGGGEAVPRSFDDVVFNSASSAAAYTATVNATSRCRSLTVAGPASGNLTFAGASTLICHGNVSFPATGFTRTFTGPVILSSASTGLTYTTNGQVFASTVTVNGIGCEWALGSALNIGATSFTVVNGLFNTANFNLTCNDLVSSNFNARTLSLGSSTISLASATPINFTLANGFTLNRGTSLLSCTATTPVFNGNGLTYYNVTFTDGSLNAKTINGANTFNNLTAQNTVVGVMQVLFSANQTIQGTLSITGNSPPNRAYALSSVLYTPRTLTVGTLVGTDCDFTDITIAGSAAGTAPTRAGDAGGNSGITFSSKSVYWNSQYGGGWNENNYGLTPVMNSVNINNFPLPQDTVLIWNVGFEGQSFTASVGTTANMYNVPGFDVSLRTRSLTFTFPTQQRYFGDLIFTTGMSNPIGASNFIFCKRSGVQRYKASTKFAGSLEINAPGGTVELLEDAGFGSVTVTRGTFDTKNFNIGGLVSFNSDNSNVRTILLGSSTITLDRTNSSWNFSTTTNLTFDVGTSVINFSNTGSSTRAFNGGNLAYNKLIIGGATGASTFSMSGTCSFNELSSVKTVAHTVALQSGTYRVNSWGITGTNNNIVSITGTGSNLIYTGSGAVPNIDYLNVQGRAWGPDYETTGVWVTTTNSINGGSFGWEFIEPPAPSGNSNFFLLFA
jgi:hypothetical protein